MMYNDSLPDVTMGFYDKISIKPEKNHSKPIMIHHDGHQVIDHTKVQEEQGEANPQNLPAFSGQSVSIKSAQRGASRSAKMRDMIEVMEKSTQQVYLPLSAYL